MDGNEAANLYGLVPNAIEEYISYTGEVSDYYQEQENGFKPLPGSIGAKELQTEFAPYIESAYSIGGFLHQAASDYVRTFARAITLHVLTIAPYAIIRNILEASCNAAWLYDPSIPTETRCKRYFGYRFRSLREQEKLLTTAGGKLPSDLYNDAIEETNSLVEKAENLGFDISREKGKVCAIGSGYPGITNLVESEYDLGSYYRIYSAVVHGHIWALRRVGFTRVQTTNDNDILYERFIDPKAVNILVEQALLVFNNSVCRKFDIFGWDKNNIDEKRIICLDRITKILSSIQ